MTSPNPPPRLGRLELRIMQVLWHAGPAPARQITDAVVRAKLTEAKSAKRRMIWKAQ